jgi:hypothetical protein
MNRREFLGAGLQGAAALAAWGWGGLALAAEPAAGARADQSRSGPSLVGLARGDHLYLPGPVIAPPGVYPQGKLDWSVVETLVGGATAAAGVASPWRLFDPADRVGLMVDVADPPLDLGLVEAVLEQLVNAGLSPTQLFIFSGRESDLFAAGFALGSQSGSGVSVFGADALGYRDDFSRLLLDRCDKLVNFARLRPHAQLGMTGAVCNCLNAVEETTRFDLLAHPDDLGSLLARRALADLLVLHLLDATAPDYAVTTPSAPGAPAATPARWEYRGLLCAHDPVALDTVGKEILEAKRAQIKGAPWPLDPAPTYLQAATSRWRVGQSDPAKIAVKAVGDRTDMLIAGG